MAVRVELPAFYVDSASFDDLGSTYFVVFNRDPEPDESGVLRSATVSFDLGTDAADSPSSTDLQVYVDVGAGEVLAYDGTAGGFQTGWDGPASSVSAIDANTLRVVIDPVTDFTSLAAVVVRVDATSTGAQDLDESWSFAVEDRTAPVLSAALATEKATVRLTFDEPVAMVGALDPATYGIERLTVPAVDVVPVSVAEIDPSTVDVTLDIEMTPGASYRVTATGVEDLFGNAITSPDDTADFVGFTPVIPSGREFDLWKMIPQKNRDEDAGELENFFLCLQEVTDLLLCGIDRWSDIADPDVAAEPYLDAMLADLGNPFDFDLTVEEKRRLIRVLLTAYRQKGTAPGIVNLVRFFLGVEVTVVTDLQDVWILGADDLGDGTILGPATSAPLYSFRVRHLVSLDAEQRDRITKIVEYMKPAHTHFLGFEEADFFVTDAGESFITDAGELFVGVA